MSVRAVQGDAVICLFEEDDGGLKIAVPMGREAGYAFGKELTKLCSPVDIATEMPKENGNGG